MTVGPGGGCQIEVLGRAVAVGVNTATLHVATTDGTARSSPVQITGDAAPTVEITAAPPALTASDNAAIFFTASDDGPLDVRCTVDEVAVVLDCTSPFALSDLTDGAHSVTVTVTDSHDQTDSDTATWTVDATAPALFLPAGVSVDANGPSGAVVTYAASATDTVDPDARVRCEPASASTFGIGDTTVLCVASDDAGNTASAEFVVHVADAAEQVDDVADDVRAAPVPAGTRTSLVAKLERVAGAIDTGANSEACTALGDFIAQVRAQRGKKIPTAAADRLITEAQRISAVLAC